MLISLKVTVQDCQAVTFDDGNGTLAEKEVFEKFYNCYFGKYFADSDSVQKYVNQRVEYSMDSQEKVETTGCPKKRTFRLSTAQRSREHDLLQPFPFQCNVADATLDFHVLWKV